MKAVLREKGLEYTRAQAAHLLSVSKRTIYRAMMALELLEPSGAKLMRTLSVQELIEMSRFLQRPAHAAKLRQLKVPAYHWHRFFAGGSKTTANPDLEELTEALAHLAGADSVPTAVCEVIRRIQGHPQGKDHLRLVGKTLLFAVQLAKGSRKPDSKG